MDADSPTRFDQLVAQVHQRAATADPAGLLDAAVAVSADHAATADRLLDRFVAHARGTGMSWTGIGARLGVSKQAARQRFADHGPMGVLPFAARPAPRLRTCLDQAGREAQADGADEIGTQHLLAGLLAMSTEAARALDAAAYNAAANASGATPPQVRTEHLLAVLALDPGSRARRVLNDLGIDIAAIKRELRCYTTVNPTRPARWWKRRPATQPSCSFCGQPSRTVGPLVNGPGVTICGACATLAREILEHREPAT
jgi:ATP-dependent Clp protease ATP-binding subunit ClpA